MSCHCTRIHDRRRIVVTGGPGSGKTAILEFVRRAFCRHVNVLPEAASILFGGGFPRGIRTAELRAAQRAIFHVQSELEAWSDGGQAPAITLCDRGTLDGLAYWPGDPNELLLAMRTTVETELNRYAAVIHLRPPAATGGYNHENRLRTESAEEAALLDARIEAAWEAHPHRIVVESTHNFLDKVLRAVELLRVELPECCGESLKPFTSLTV